MSLSTTATTAGKSLTIDKLNPRVIEAQYAVRGELVLKSMQYATELKSSSSTLPFDSIIACNIGNPQAVIQALRFSGYPIYLNTVTDTKGRSRNVYRLGTPSKAVIAAGYRALATS